jgi:hypothetical protein
MFTLTTSKRFVEAMPWRAPALPFVTRAMDASWSSDWAVGRWQWGSNNMPFDATPDGNPGRPSCRACKQPIWHGQPATRVDFRTDPDGSQGLTGVYHKPCSRPFLSLARVVNLNPWSGF